MDIIASLYTILLVKQLFNEFSIALYVKKVILPCFIVTLISLGSVYVINQIISQSLLRLILGFVFNLRGVKRNAINRVVRKNDNDFDN